MLKYTSLPVLLSIHLAHSRCQILLQIPHTFWIFPFSFLYFFLFLHHAIFFLFQSMLDSLERNVLFLRILGQSGTKCPISPHLLHLFFFLFASNAFLIPS